MKRIIDGVTYNTDTSTAIASEQWQDEREGKEAETVLYQTRGGAFFLHHTIERSYYDREEGEHRTKVHNEFEPMTRAQAHDWMMKGEKEIIHNVFEDPPEAADTSEPEAVIYIRVPKSLADRIETAAREERLSKNAFMLRCAERCVAKDRA